MTKSKIANKVEQKEPPSTSAIKASADTAGTATKTASNSSAASIVSGIKITEVRISNFRSFENLALELEDFTVLIGANNAGKTSFLDAIYAAIGASRKLLGKDDIHLASDEIEVPRDRKAIIDVLIRPTGTDKAIIKLFPAAEFWTNLWGTEISQDDDFSEFVGIRCAIGWSVAAGDYKVEKKFLKEWLPLKNWTEAEEKGPVSASQLEPLALHYIDAKRDIDDDLKQRGSFWRKLTESLGLSDDDTKQLESILSDLNQQIIDKSDVLTYALPFLNQMKSIISSEASSISITPVARHLRDLTKGIDVSFSTLGAQSFPLVRHGMGTRSLASILVFRAYVAWKEKLSQHNGDTMHPMLALEEPEAHLHPQAQRSLFRQIKEVSGQIIVSTHSPYFAGQAKLEQLALFSKEKSKSKAKKLDLTQIGPDERRHIENKIIQTRGDLLFARGVLFFEGDTEEQALPIFAEKYWSKSIHEMGLSLVGVGGKDFYYPFATLTQQLDIPWFIFSDGEDEAIKSVDACLKKMGLGDHANVTNITVIPKKADFEKSLIDDGYLPEIETAFNKVHGSAAYLDNYIKEKQGQKRKGGILRDYTVPGGREQAALDALHEQKTLMAIPVANQICEGKNKAGPIPAPVKLIFDKIAQKCSM